MQVNTNHDVSSDIDNVTNDISDDNYNISGSYKPCDTNDITEKEDDITISDKDVMDTNDNREQDTKKGYLYKRYLWQKGGLKTRYGATILVAIMESATTTNSLWRVALLTKLGLWHR